VLSCQFGGEHGGMMQWRRIMGSGAVLLAVMALSGCGGVGADVPDAVKTMMAAEFPADGQIHVQSRGKIVIKPETPVCRHWKKDGDFGVGSAKLFLALRQADAGPDGSERQLDAAEAGCRQSKSVVTFGRRFNNRNGEPYKLVLAVWQGDPAKGGAVWVGRVERAVGIRPEQMRKQPFRDGIPPPSWVRNSQDRRYQIEKSQELDVKDLSLAFLQSLIEKAK
jgi:hypothetical protein